MNKTISVLATIALMLAAHTTAKAADYVPRIIAGVVKADSWTMGNNREGIYQLTLGDSPRLEPLTDGRDVYMAPLGGAVYQDGTMYGIHFRQEWDPYEQANTYTIYNVAYDMKTWTRTRGQALGSMYGNLISSCGITHDPVTGLNFGIFYNFNMSYQVIDRKLATIDFVSTEQSGAPKKSIIGVVSTPFAAIAASDNGLLYGVGHDGYLYIIDKAMSEDAGEVTVIPIGYLGLDNISTNPSSMTFDPRTKKLYWAYVTTAGKSVLYEIGYTIGAVAATKLADVPDNSYLVNMYIAPMEADDDAPAAVQKLDAHFDGEQTTGTVSFTMPTTTYAGTPLVAELSYTIYADGQAVATGRAVSGTTVSQTVTIDSDGRDVEISVRAANSKGDGPAEKLIRYVGRDVPTAVTALHLAYDETTQQALLSWQAPLTGQHGYTLSAANLSYDVVRLPDSVVVARGLRATTFAEPLDASAELTLYSYTVTPYNAQKQGPAATSAKVPVGQALEPPFDEYFTSQAAFDRFTVIDANADGQQWQRYHHVYQYSGTTADYAQMYSHSTNADDDYLLTPPLRLVKGGRYELSFTAKKEYGDKLYDQKLRVLVGRGSNVADYWMVMDTIYIDDVNFTKYSKDIVVDEDGIYQIALHAVSNAGSGPVDIDELHLAASILPSAPAMVSNVVLTPAADGDLAATLTCTAPLLNMGGDQLAAIDRIDVTDVQSEQLVGTLANPAPGQTCTISLTQLLNGTRTYSVVAWLDGAPSPKATATAFIGQDIPTPPTNIMLMDNGTEAVLTWKAPTHGINGLRLNQQRLKYNLYTLADDGYADLYQRDVTSPYLTGQPTATGDQHLLYYVLDAETTGGLSELAVSSSLIVGESYPLPFAEHFEQGATQFVWMEGDQATANIGITSELSSDGDGRALAFVPTAADYAFFNLGKVSLAGAAKPVLAFDYYALPAPTTATLGVMVMPAPQLSATTLKQIDLQQETTTGWKHIELDLSPYAATSYIIVKFAMASLMDAEQRVPIVIDNITIADAHQTAIADATTQGQRSHATFSLGGVRQPHGVSLPKGLYIRDGRKVVVK